MLDITLVRKSNREKLIWIANWMPLPRLCCRRATCLHRSGFSCFARAREKGSPKNARFRMFMVENGLIPERKRSQAHTLTFTAQQDDVRNIRAVDTASPNRYRANRIIGFSFLGELHC